MSDQLKLTHPVPLREAIARECARITDRAERDASKLRAEGKGKRADELLADRQRLVASIQRGSAHAVRGRRRP